MSGLTKDHSVVTVVTTGAAAFGEAPRATSDMELANIKPASVAEATRRFSPCFFTAFTNLPWQFVTALLVYPQMTPR
ncbi:MAG TPA: hypothetical protein VND89_05930 [Acidimicrobiales bacterium]|nr:hypothetical protein [Acidimicrobiales bacterium]